VNHAHPPAQRLRVVIADDHPVYREGLAGLIGTEDGLDVIGRATNGREAVEMVTSLQPDLLVLDLDMPEFDGMAALHEISARGLGTAVLVLTMYGDDDAVFEAMKAGARGYLVKSSDPEQILRALRTVADGGVVLSAVLGARMSDWFGTLQQEHGPLSQLTPREREVLNLMCRGRDNAAIAAALGISPKTVRNVVSSIFTKLGVAHRAEAIAKARQAGGP
jgi:DNA-binding NarL/FixJ family response regulator